MTGNLLEFTEFDPDNEDHVKFVVSGWLDSYRRSRWAGVIPNNLYRSVTLDCIHQLLARGMRVVLLESRKIGTFVGFIAFEQSETPVLHYIYVKKVLQKRPELPAARMLLEYAGFSKETEFLYTFPSPGS